jgi:hypothetical protein
MLKLSRLCWFQVAFRVIPAHTDFAGTNGNTIAHRAYDRI